MKKRIFAIKSMSAFSAAGATLDENWEAIRDGKSKIVFDENLKNAAVTPYADSVEKLLQKADNSHFKQYDRSIKAALLTAREAFEKSGRPEKEMIINFGSSRGATGYWEKNHQEFLQSGKTGPKTSPFTTLGNISSSIAKYLRTDSASIDHSITCGTGLQALANSMAWLQSGMAQSALFGASEAPLTPFSLAQMKALGIYSDYKDDFPCKPCYNGADKKNSMVLGEGSVACFAELFDEKNDPSHYLVFVESVGLANENISSPASVSANGDALFKAMSRAMKNSFNTQIPDVIVAHSPGTINGDLSEFNAIQKLFGKEIPAITSNKHIVGHTLAASGLLSLMMAIEMLKRQEFIRLPYSVMNEKSPKKIEKVMVNAQGFGGNAISVIVSLTF